MRQRRGITERAGVVGEMAYKYQIDKNCIPHCDDFLENGYTKEEMKLSNETQKILDSSISVSATAVRIPVVGGHSESINIELENSFDIADITQLLKETSGVTVKDDINNLECYFLIICFRRPKYLLTIVIHSVCD